MPMPKNDRDENQDSNNNHTNLRFYVLLDYSY